METNKKTLKEIDSEIAKLEKQLGKLGELRRTTITETRRTSVGKCYFKNGEYHRVLSFNNKQKQLKTFHFSVKDNSFFFSESLVPWSFYEWEEISEEVFLTNYTRFQAVVKKVLKL
jgi:hypothetical protein